MEQNEKEILRKQRVFFETGQTTDINFRLEQLKKLHQAIARHEDDIYSALFEDFKKCKFEVYASEISLVQEEIKFFLKKLPKLTRPQKVKTHIASVPARSYIQYEPFGLSLIIGPWNYPFMLAFSPLVASISAGNCAIIKPSELTKNTSALTKKIVNETFDESYIAVVEGAKEATQLLLEQPFDFTFFTGSVRVGKIIYQAAAKQLTPCVLELGGKSPCIVDKDAKIDQAAKKIVWGKLLNGGQTCIAPDYLLAHGEIKTKLLEKIAFYIEHFYGSNPKESQDYPRIINEANFDRLKELLRSSGKIIIGGETDRNEKYIAPTIIDEISWDDKIMEDEIFGPILPVIEFSDLEPEIQKIKKRPKPLALYYFSESKKAQDKILREVSFGGGCINDTLLQFASTALPFGGVGSSGLGKYHGKESFYTFSNKKSIVRKSTLLDVPLRYAPYKNKLNFVKRFI